MTAWMGSQLARRHDDSARRSESSAGDALVDAATAVRLLGVKERTVRELRARRELPVVRAGQRLIRHRLSDLFAYADVHTEPALRGPLADPGWSDSVSASRGDTASESPQRLRAPRRLA
ncbi:MAG: helix-turn-helix domain-containing protein [Acidimicrobiales bacterium]